MIFEIKDYPAMHAAIAELCDTLQKSSVPSERVFDSKLVISELVGNVLRHTDGKATLRGEINGEFIELTIHSSVAFLPPEKSRPADVYAESGRGLFLVDSVSEERSCTKDGEIRVRIKMNK